ncbi:MAG: tetratricopeptide repeat protein [Anaerolineae bacterium]
MADFAEAQELYRKGDPDGAAVILEGIVESEPENIAARLLLVRSYSRMRQGEDAVAEIDAVLEREPDNAEALTLRGAEYYFADELREAADTLQRAIDLDPDTTEARARLAQVLTDSKEYTEAGEVLDEAESKAEDRPDALALVRMARVYLVMQRRDHTGALKLIEDNEELWKTSPYVAATVRSNHAIIKARQRDFAGARDLLVDALDYDPYFYSARSLLGQIAAMQKDHQLAVDQLQQVIDSGTPVSAHVQYALASSLTALGRPEEANEHYREALSVGLSGIPAITARLSVAIPNLKVRLALLGVVVLLLALVAFRFFAPVLAGALVLMFAILGYQIVKGGR